MKIKCKHPLSTGYFRPYACEMTLKNEHGQIMGDHCLSQKENYEEIEGFLKLHLERHRQEYGNHWIPKVIYIDICCKWRAKLENLFLSPVDPTRKTEIKLDAFHWFQRWDKAIALPKTDPRCKRFYRLLSIAVLAPAKTSIEEAFVPFPQYLS